jgi:hypothetical protein
VRDLYDWNPGCKGCFLSFSREVNLFQACHAARDANEEIFLEKADAKVSSAVAVRFDC